MLAGMSTPACPRCGYDLSGLVATWVERCPLEARCSECGLDFDCGNVLSQGVLGPAWSFEHARRRRLRAWWATSHKALRIWPLVDGLRVDHALRPRRLLRFVGMWLLVGWLFASVLVFVVSPNRGWWGGGMGDGLGKYEPFDVGEWLNMVREVAWPYGEVYIPTGPGASLNFTFAPLLLVIYMPVLAVPLGMLVFSTTFATARLRQILLLRGLACSVPAAVIAAHGLLLLLVLSVLLAGGPGRDGVLEIIAMGIWLGFNGWLLVWWWMFIKRHLRLRHALVTALLMVAQANLLTIVLLLFYAMR
jgi:hypothetical protein